MKRSYLSIILLIVAFAIAIAFKSKGDSQITNDAYNTTVVPESPTPSNDYDHSLYLLKEYIESSIKQPKNWGTFPKKYYHPDSFILGSDVMKIVVIPNKTTDAWKIKTVELVYENLNPESTEKEQFLKVVVEFQSLAQAIFVYGFNYELVNEQIEITFYLAQNNGEWLIYDMNVPGFPVLTLDSTLEFTEKKAQNLSDEAINQFITELIELKNQR